MSPKTNTVFFLCSIFIPLLVGAIIAVAVVIFRNPPQTGVCVETQTGIDTPYIRSVDTVDISHGVLTCRRGSFISARPTVNGSTS